MVTGLPKVQAFIVFIPHANAEACEVTSRAKAHPLAMPRLMSHGQPCQTVQSRCVEWLTCARQWEEFIFSAMGNPRYLLA